jgi:hypothetical protein
VPDAVFLPFGLVLVAHFLHVTITQICGNPKVGLADRWWERLLKGKRTDIRERRRQAHRVVNLSDGVAPAARLQNRTGEFPRIRLLNDRVFGTDTFDTSGVSFIMAMSVQ